LEKHQLADQIHQRNALVIGIYDKKVDYELAMEYLEELKFLAESAEAKIVHTFMQTMTAPKVGTYFGTGKLEEIKMLCDEYKADVVIIDEDLTPTQVRNIEKVVERAVMDRSALILFIFSERARTAQAKAQVELAQLQYMLPRLTKMWTHLSRERGGIGLKGAGEQEIETDRRIIRTRIAKLKEELKKIEQQDLTRRKHRDETVRVALVGYTNVGKSTLMNLLSKSDVYAENKLFATLDTTVRKVVIDNVPFLLSDTVGFIRKLPTLLVESFKSTLSEAREADILLHVVDISNTHYIEHIKVVKNTLADIKAIDKPTIMVFNKIDELEAEDIIDLEQSWMQSQHAPAVFISAYKKINIDKLRAEIIKQVVAVSDIQIPSYE